MMAAQTVFCVGALLSPAIPGNPPIDAASGFVIVCAYTGKEVV
jgi:hypothetical protein